MPYSSREMALTIKFVDDASGAIDTITQKLSTFQRTGGGLLATGIVLERIGNFMGNIGKAGVGFFNSAVDSAIAYSHEAAKALTQTEGLGITLDQVKKIGYNVGNTVGVQFESIQPALYDIFSTTSLGAEGAQRMLTLMGKAAVAGKADIKDVTDLSIQQMNSYGLSVDDLNHLLDLQFNLVRFGKGDYAEFAHSMGLSVPTARAAGQSLENYSGALAFMSKNSPSVARATASVGRALELMYGAKGQAGLKKLGIDIRDSNGNIKSMQQIITELAVDKGWAKLDSAQRAIKFKETFGQGAIQARRFFDVAIPEYAALNDITAQVSDSQGALNKAYDTMSNEPAVKAEILHNKYMQLKNTIGDQLIPVKIKLMEAISRLIDWWNKLDPKVQNTIIKIAALAAGFLAVAGPVISFIGSILSIIGILSFLGGSLLAAMAIIGVVLVVLALLAIAGYEIYKHWDKVKPVLIDIWGDLKAAYDAFISGFQGKNDMSGTLGFFQDLGRYSKEAWDRLKEFWEWLKTDAWPVMKQGWADVKEKAEKFWTWLRDDAAPKAKEAFNTIKDDAQKLWDKLTEFWNWLDTTFGPGFERVWKSLKDNIGPVITEMQQFSDEFIKDSQDLYNQVSPIFDDIGRIFSRLWNVFIHPILETIKIDFQAAWEFIRTYTKDVWDFITRLIGDNITITSNIIRLFLNILQGDWSGAWENIKNILRAAWDVIAGIVRFGWETVKALFWLGVNSVGEIGRYMINLLIGEFRKLPGAIEGVFAGAGRWLWNAGTRIIGGLIDGIESKVGALKSKLQSMTAWIPTWKGPKDVDKQLLFGNGELIMQGLVRGLDSGMGDVKSYLSNVTAKTNFMPNISVGAFGQQPQSNQFDLEDMTRRIVEAIHGIKPTNIEHLQVGDTKQESTLDFWGSVKNAGNS